MTDLARQNLSIERSCGWGLGPPRSQDPPPSDRYKTRSTREPIAPIQSNGAKRETNKEERERGGGDPHVEEYLKSGVEALVGDLKPEVVQLLLGDLPHPLPPPPRQRVEYPHRELLRVHPWFSTRPEMNRQRRNHSKALYQSRTRTKKTSVCDFIQCYRERTVFGEQMMAI